MLVLGNSWSMSYKAGCEQSCALAGVCDGCLPNCPENEQSRWTQLVEVLVGTFKDYRCVEGGPGDAPDLIGWTTSSRTTRNADGLLDAHMDDLRFGLAVFDTAATYADDRSDIPMQDFDVERSARAEGMWSFNPERVLGHRITRADGSRIGDIVLPPTVGIPDSYVDLGIRGTQAQRGRLQAAFEASASREVNASIQRDLENVRPTWGAPVAAALEDLYYFLKHALPEGSAASDTEIVLVASEDPDPRLGLCECSSGAASFGSGVWSCSSIPAMFDVTTLSCAYPEPEAAVRLLRCGPGPGCSHGVADKVDVVAFDAFTGGQLDDIADGGGTLIARSAANKAELRLQLEDILRQASQ